MEWKRSVLLLGCIGLTVACEPCAGKTGEELEECEAETAIGSGDVGVGGGEGEGHDNEPGEIVFSDEVPGSGDWVSDNVEGVHNGETAIHPRAMVAGGMSSMTFDCGAVAHTQLSFHLLAPQANRLQLSDVALELYVDGATEPRATFGAYFDTNHSWRQYVVNVPQGTHGYTFSVRTEVDLDPPFVLDTFECRYAAEENAENLRVDFDDAIVPVEVVLADGWAVDNTVAVHEGQAAVHAPALVAGGEASMVFNCGGAEHTQFAFSLLAPTANTKQLSDVALELFVDNEEAPRAVFGGYFDTNHFWRDYLINVPADAHTYAFKVSTEIDIPSPFVLDTFACRNNLEEPAENVRVDFDDGIVPVEFQLHDGWAVDNTVGVHEGDAALHAPALSAGDSASVDFDCGGVEHSIVKFWLLAPEGNRQQLEDLSMRLFVDDEEEPRETFGAYFDTNHFWREFVVGTDAGLHTYAFTVDGEVDVAPPFVMDTFSCE